MTFKERLKEDYPEYVLITWAGSIIKCPCDYGYERPDNKPCFSTLITCSECWNREMPEEVKEEEKEMINEHCPKFSQCDHVQEVRDCIGCANEFVNAVVTGEKECIIATVPRKQTKKDVEPNEVKVSTIKDSGERTKFSSGAQRDMHGGKGRMDLLPWAAIMEVSKHCENGANKYGEHNVDLGIPTSSLCDSAARHLAKYVDGWTDEPHLVAAAWNLLWAIQMELKHPEMVNTPWKPENKSEASV